jgi:ABC-2 type transport system permease protein
MTDHTSTIIQPVTQEKHSKLYWIMSDSLVLIKRSMTHIIKNPDQLLSVAFQPIMFMLLFRYIFGGAINTGPTTYVNFLMAGILIQTAAFGSLSTAIGVANDLQRGIIDRFRSLPMNDSTVLTGHVVADLVRNLMSSAIMLTVGLFVGFRPTATFTEWLLVIALLMLFTFAISWLAAVMGLIAKSVEAVQWIGFVAIFPLTFASSAFVPTETMHKGLRPFAEHQPVTQVIQALRALLVDTPMNNHYWVSVIWCIGIILVSVPLAAYLFRKREVK